MIIWQKLSRSLRSFRSDRSGNVALIFGLAALPIIAFVGYAIDYSRANAVKVALQSAVDSTALMLSKEVGKDTATQLQTSAQNYFNAMFNRPGLNATVTAIYSTSSATQLRITGTADVPTLFLGVINQPTFHVSADSTAKWGSTRLRVALVLDNTGSMSQSGKIGALQTATKALLTQLQSAVSTNGDVYVSIIPFVKDVNVDSSNYNGNWIYWGTAAQDLTLSDNLSWDANNGSCSVSGQSTRSSCVQQGSCSISGHNSQSSCTSAGACSNPAKTTQSSCTGTQACSNSNYTSQSSCTSHGGTWGYGTWSAGVWTKAIWTPNNHNTWNGCVEDRGDPGAPNSGNYDTNVAAPVSTNNATLYAAEQYSSCPQAAMGLSYNWSAMTSLVNAMSPNGNTNQGLGLQLGWMSLAGGGPFTVPTMDSNYTYQQVIILLTDGLNTEDRWYTSQNSIDARQQITCNNIKAASITLYTIQVNTSGDPTSTLLQNCATDSSKFFLLTSAGAIGTTFNQIGTNLTKLRVAQ